MGPANRELIRRNGLALGGAFLVSIVSWWLLFIPDNVATGGHDKSAQGRSVFVKEGCWYCHHPTLPGQRWASVFKQPVSSAWLKAYLYHPRGVDRTARKQTHHWLSYKAPNQKHSDADLLARYLGTMGGGSQRGGLTLTERHFGRDRSFDLREARHLYKRNCSGCHGLEGRGEARPFRRSKKSQKRPALLRRPRPATDLTDPARFVCRSGEKLTTSDVHRTLARGMSHSEMIPFYRRLTAFQLRSLTEYVRQFGPQGYARTTALSQRRSRPVPPKARGWERNAQFRNWRNRWWRSEYKIWEKKLEAKGERSWIRLTDRKAWKDWKGWIRWQRFSAWVSAHPQELHVTQADWRADMRQRFTRKYPKAVAEWNKRRSRVSLYKWVRRWVFEKLRQEKKLTREENEIRKKLRELNKQERLWLQAYWKKQAKTSLVPGRRVKPPKARALGRRKTRRAPPRRALKRRVARVRPKARKRLRRRIVARKPRVIARKPRVIARKPRVIARKPRTRAPLRRVKRKRSAKPARRKPLRLVRGRRKPRKQRVKKRRRPRRKLAKRRRRPRRRARKKRAQRRKRPRARLAVRRGGPVRGIKARMPLIRLTRPALRLALLPKTPQAQKKAQLQKELDRLRVRRRKLDDWIARQPTIGRDDLACKLPYRLRRNLPARHRSCIHDLRYSINQRLRERNGHRDYKEWRLQVERKRFNNERSGEYDRRPKTGWKWEQRGWLYRAWQGSKVYSSLRCGSCHGLRGEGKLVKLPFKQDVKIKKKGYTGWTQIAHQVPPFAAGQLRCGSSAQELFHTLRMFVEGKGPHLGLSVQQLRKGTSFYRRRFWRFQRPEQIDTKVRQLAAYVRFLARELPITRRVSPGALWGKNK